MTKATATNILPRLKLLDAQKGRSQRNEVLSSCIQDYFSENDDTINILEAGCGRKWSLDLNRIKYKLTGIDIDKNALELRKTTERDLDKAILGDLRYVEFDREEFDIIYCVTVIEHIDGTEEVIDNFFKWLKPGGLLILVFPDRDSIFGFITRLTPHWFHVFVYRHIYKKTNAGKLGFPPFPTYYNKIVSRRAIHDYCKDNGHNVVLEYGRPFNFRKLGRLALGTIALFKVMHYLSFKKFTANHADLICVIQK